jgi:low affinity Fe/Cu permease
MNNDKKNACFTGNQIGALATLMIIAVWALIGPWLHFTSPLTAAGY